MSVAAKLAEFESEWNEEPLPIEEVVDRLQTGVYPTSLFVFHKDYGTLSFGEMNPNDYLVARMGPPIDKRRGGLARTFGNLRMESKWILPHIDDIFDNVSGDIDLQRRSSAKLIKLQSEAARKMLNKSSQNIPREMQNIVAQMIGEKKPVTAAYSVPNSMAKINTSLFNEEVNMPRHLKKVNTTLFANGGKRKSRRRQRGKTTRRRR